MHDFMLHMVGVVLSHTTRHSRVGDLAEELKVCTLKNETEGSDNEKM